MTATIEYSTSEHGDIKYGNERSADHSDEFSEVEPSDKFSDVEPSNEYSDVKTSDEYRDVEPGDKHSEEHRDEHSYEYSDVEYECLTAFFQPKFSYKRLIDLLR